MTTPEVPFVPTWQSLQTQTTPQWYLDGKFGIFIHWGLYAVPAFVNEWYARNMYIAGTSEFEHHRQTYGDQATFGYKDFIPMFRAEAYDPQAWAALFAASGAKFIVPVAEHHDGFAMYDSGQSEWTAARKGPKRDLIGDLARAVTDKGMVFGVSSHRAEHWWFLNGGRAFDSDVNQAENEGLYGPATPISTPEWNSTDWQPRPDALFLEDWLARCCELVDLYRPQLFWFDWWIEQTVFQPYLQRFASYYYNRAREWGMEVAINYKNQAFAEGSAVLDIERGQLKSIRPYFWQNDTSVSKNSWGYVKEQDYKTPTSIIGDLVDVVSKNGALLLNIGPRPDGTIPEAEQEILRDIGAWLAINGEAIYNTRPWRVYGEGPTDVPEGSFTDTKREAFTAQDIRFTATCDALYATLLGWSPDGTITIKSLTSGSEYAAGLALHELRLLGSEKLLQWEQTEDGLVVHLPQQPACDHAYVIKIT